MAVRRATFADLPGLSPMLEEMHAESRYSANQLDLEKTLSLAGRLIVSKNGVVFLSKNGMLWAGIGEYWFGPESYAFEYILFVRREARRGAEGAELLQAYVAWAAENGIAPRNVWLENSTGVESAATEKFFAAQGFSRVGGKYVLEA